VVMLDGEKRVEPDAEKDVIGSQQTYTG